MKKALLLLIILPLTLVSCDAQKGEANIKAAFPEYEVARLPGVSYNYILRSKEGEVFFAVSDGFSSVSEKNLIPIFKAIK